MDNVEAAPAPEPTRTRIGVCNLCEAICGLEVTIGGDDGATVTSVRGNPADPLSRGYICPKGVSLADVYADPDRLRRPVRRVGRGVDATWEELDWEEALDLVADRITATIREQGRYSPSNFMRRCATKASRSSSRGRPISASPTILRWRRAVSNGTRWRSSRPAAGKRTAT